MKAAHLVGPKHFEIVDTEVPEVSDGNCLVNLERWSICGSDMRYEYGTVFPEEHYPVDVGAPCHELAGTIVESRSDEWREGQRVIIIPDTHQGLVEYYESLPNRIIALPDDGDIGEWLMCQPSGTVLFALQQLGTLLGRTVLVIGQGAIGQSFTAIAARAGARRVIAADLFDYRLEYSTRLGATHTINPSTELLDEAVEEITGGELADVTVEAAGYTDTFAAACRLVKAWWRYHHVRRTPEHRRSQSDPPGLKPATCSTATSLSFHQRRPRAAASPSTSRRWSACANEDGGTRPK